MTDWNSCYRDQNTPWDKGLPTPVLAEVAAKHGEVFRGRVLVPGCGLGHDARALADRGLKVTGADIAPLAIEKAQALDPDHRVDFRLVDIFSPPDDLQGVFDLVWEHTCLCALPIELRTQYVQGVKVSLKPEGMVAGVFFINPEMDPGEEGPPFGISVEDLEKLWGDEGFVVVDSWVPETGYPGRVGRERAMVLRRKK